MKYSYTKQGNQLRFKYCPICDKIKENPDFTINIAEGVYFCFSNNIGGRIENLSKYGFDIGEIPELRGFSKGNKNYESLRGDNPLNSQNKSLIRKNGVNKDNFLSGDIKKYYKNLMEDNSLNTKDSSLNGENLTDKTLSNGGTNNFNDDNSFNKERYGSIKKTNDSRDNRKDIDLTSIFLARKDKFLNDEWIKYLASRCISDKYLKKFARLGKSNTMMIPLTNGKKVVGIKYRTIDKKIFSERESQSDYLLGWQLIKDFSYIIIVEGEIDLLSALEVGFSNVVSLPFGAGNLKSIENQKDWLSSFEKIIIATDNDTQGKKSKDEIVKILSNVKDKLYEVDLGIYKDFNEVLTSGLKDNQSKVTNQNNKILENQPTDNKLDNTNQTYLNNRTLENNSNDSKLNEINEDNVSLENRLKSKYTDSQSKVTNQNNKTLENQSTDNKSDNTNQTYLNSRTLENNSTDKQLTNTNQTNQLNNTDLKNNSTDNKSNNTNQTLINIGKERLIEIIKNPIKIKDKQSIRKDIEEKISPFSKGIDGYYYNLTTKITDFLLDIRSFSDNYIFGTVTTGERKREFFAKKTDLLTKNGILENLGYFLGSISLIPNFWSWILEVNNEKYIPEIEHYGIIEGKYYDTTSDIICGKVDLKIKPLKEIPDFTYEEKNWCDENIFGLRKDINQSLLGICWALGRFHIEGTYPILEVSGTTSIGKTEFIEFISRILFGTKENIKSLATLSNHQIRSLSSCSNITPWAIDEIKISSRYQKEKAIDLYSTIRSVYDNKTINQGNITSKLTEFKLCTPLIISGETEISDVSIKNRTISIELNQKNKCSRDVFAKFKNELYLEKFGKLALEDRLNNGKIVLPDWEVKNKLDQVTDDRQIYNGMCILTGLKALERVMPFNGDLEDSFLKFLNKKLSDHYTPTANFLELLELVRDSGKDVSHFYQIKGDRHFVRFSMLYKAIREEWEQTNSNLELLDMKTLKKQLIEEKFIINESSARRFPKNDFSIETICVRCCEIVKNNIFIKDFFDED